MRVSCFCGTIYDSDTADGECPYCGAVVDSPATHAADTAPPPSELLNANRQHALLNAGSVHTAQIAAWRTERREIRESVQWAYAMGDGCSMGYLPTESRAVLQRERDLAALIAEHTA